MILPLAELTDRKIFTHLITVGVMAVERTVSFRSVPVFYPCFPRRVVLFRSVAFRFLPLRPFSPVFCVRAIAHLCAWDDVRNNLVVELEVQKRRLLQPRDGV